MTTKAHAELDSRVGVLSSEKKKLEDRVQTLSRDLTLAKEFAAKESARIGVLERELAAIKGLYSSLAARSEQVDERVEMR